jgi:hypothetical protein
MPNFVATTGVYRTINLQTRNPTNPVRAVTLPGYVPDIETAVAVWEAQGGNVPADQTLWGGFELRWLASDMRAYLVLGAPQVTKIGGHLAVDIDFWESQAQHDANPNAPVMRDTLIHTAAQTVAQVRQVLIELLVRATANNYSGDRREPRANLSTDPAFDTVNHWFDKPFVQSLEGTVLP